MNNKRLFLFIVSLFLITLGVVYVFGISSLTRGGIDIVDPENGTRIYAFQNFALNANLLVTNATTNVTWYIQDTVGVNTSIFSHNFAQNTTNGTSNYTGGWGAVAQGRYNITLVASNDTQYSTNGTNLSVGGIGTCTLSASQQCNNATGGYNILLINKLDQLSYTTNLSGRAINIINPTAGQNISGIYRFNATIADLNMTTNVTWILTNSSGRNSTLGINNALNNLNVTNDTTGIVLDGTYQIFLRATNNSVGINSTLALNTPSLVDANITIVRVSNVVIDNTQPAVSVELSDPDARIITRAEIKVTCENSDVTSGIMADNNTIKLTKPDGEVLSFLGVTEKTFKDLDVAPTGQYTVECEAHDYANNIRTESKTFQVKARSGPEVGVPSFDYDLSIRDTAALSGREGSTKTFTFDGTTTHTIEFLKVTETSVTIKISSTPQEFTLSIGDSKEADLNDDRKLDLRVTLKSITNGRASMTVEKLVGAAMIGPEGPEEKPTPKAEEEKAPPTRPLVAGAGATTAVIVIIVIIIVVVGGYFLWKGKGKGKKGHVKFSRAELRQPR